MATVFYLSAISIALNQSRHEWCQFFSPLFECAGCDVVFDCSVGSISSQNYF